MTVKVFDLQTAKASVEQILFTLADLDEWYTRRPQVRVLPDANTSQRARANPSQQFSGWLNLVIMELNLLTLYKRNMLLCEEW